MKCLSDPSILIYIPFNDGRMHEYAFVLLFVAKLLIYLEAREEEIEQKKEMKRTTPVQSEKKKHPQWIETWDRTQNYVEILVLRDEKNKFVCVCTFEEIVHRFIGRYWEKIRLLLIRVFVDVCYVEISLKQKPHGKSKDSIVFLYFLYCCFFFSFFLFLCLFSLYFHLVSRESQLLMHDIKARKEPCACIQIGWEYLLLICFVVKFPLLAPIPLLHMWYSILHAKL